jgi:hypothetical protein
VINAVPAGFQSMNGSCRQQIRGCIGSAAARENRWNRGHFGTDLRPSRTGSGAAAGLLQGSRLQSADPSVWISSGRIARGPFEVEPKAREALGGSVRRAALPGPKVLERRIRGVSGRRHFNESPMRPSDRYRTLARLSVLIRPASAGPDTAAHSGHIAAVLNFRMPSQSTRTIKGFRGITGKPLVTSKDQRSKDQLGESEWRVIEQVAWEASHAAAES